MIFLDERQKCAERDSDPTIGGCEVAMPTGRSICEEKCYSLRLVSAPELFSDAPREPSIR